MSILNELLAEVFFKSNVLPKCKHGYFLADWSGDLLVPPCGCKIEIPSIFENLEKVKSCNPKQLEWNVGPNDLFAMTPMGRISIDSRPDGFIVALHYWWQFAATLDAAKNIAQNHFNALWREVTDCAEAQKSGRRRIMEQKNRQEDRRIIKDVAQFVLFGMILQSIVTALLVSFGIKISETQQVIVASILTLIVVVLEIL